MENKCTKNYTDSVESLSIYCIEWFIGVNIVWQRFDAIKNTFHLLCNLFIVIQNEDGEKYSIWEIILNSDSMSQTDGIQMFD